MRSLSEKKRGAGGPSWPPFPNSSHPHPRTWKLSKDSPPAVSFHRITMKFSALITLIFHLAPDASLKHVAYFNIARYDSKDPD
jgi:hypothetical protein